ncbi:hypothetical protein V6N13_006237 [Hibiscus sabdariffa]
MGINKEYNWKLTVTSLVNLLQTATASNSIPITSVARHFPTSVLSEEQQDDYRLLPVLHFIREDKAYPPGENSPLSLNMQSVAADTEELMNVEPSNVVALAKKALSASKQAASLAEDLKLDLDDSLSNSLGSANSSTLPVEEEAVTLRSNKRLERQSKRRRVQPKVSIQETYSSRRKDVRRKLSESSDPNDPLRLFLCPETKQVLTAEEESELIIQVQDLKRLVKVKSRTSIRKKKLEKLIHANLHMVVHVAKQYQCRGLSLQDLLQERSIGLMKSVEKFKPQVGCDSPPMPNGG